MKKENMPDSQEHLDFAPALFDRLAEAFRGIRIPFSPTCFPLPVHEKAL
jgi:hypothetical protein